MIDHVGLRTRNFARMSMFYEAVLAPLGYRKLFTYEGGAGFGAGGGTPSIWIGEAEQASTGIHLAIASPTRAAVQAFHAAALGLGAPDNGAPGLRLDYSPNYYAAFVLDPDGNNIEAVCHEPERGT